jgi:hypothetical protein
MTIDRYTKMVLTVIAACLVWLSVGGPSLMTAVNAQIDDPEFRSPRLRTFGTQFGKPEPLVQAADPVGDYVILAGWRDQYGNVRPFADPYPLARPEAGKPTPAAAFPIWQQP